MPHVAEFHVTPDHDGHDQLLVAALAAGDLTGIDRDHALALTRSCASCAELHDDLLAITRATAVLPAPAARRRDFQLTPADAARLRPAGWRRLLGGIAGARAFASQPLGVGLATLGLVGLLIGNVSILPVSQSASTPQTSAGGVTTSRSQFDSSAASQAAASAAPEAALPAPSAAASAPAGGGDYGAQPVGRPSPSGDDRGAVSGTISGAQGASSAAGAGSGAPVVTDASGGPKAADGATRELAATPQSSDGGPFRPLNLLFGGAVLAGLAILVAARIRRRPAA